MSEIDMSRFVDSKAKILNDRDRGIEVRKKSELDSIESKGEDVIILIPKDLWSMTPSFFGGMFESSINKYRKDFFKHVKFKYKGGEELNEVLQNKMQENFEYVLERLENG